MIIKAGRAVIRCAIPLRSPEKISPLPISIEKTINKLSKAIKKYLDILAIK